MPLSTTFTIFFSFTIFRRFLFFIAALFTATNALIPSSALAFQFDPASIDLLQSVGLTTTQIEIIEASPLDDFITQKCDFKIDRHRIRSIISFLRKYGVKKIGKAIFDFPPILRLSIPNNLAPKVAWFQNQGVKDIGKVLSLFPAVLGKSITDNFEPKVAWLSAHGVKDIGRVLTLFPAILGYSITDNLNPKITWLKNHGVKRIGRVITLFPSILGYRISDKLEPKVMWLKDHGVKDIGLVLTKYPSVLGLSTKNNLDPTWEHLTATWGFTAQTIEGTPSLLGASLKRTIPLSQWLRAIGVHPANLPNTLKDRCIRSISMTHVLDSLKRLGLIPTTTATWDSIPDTHWQALSPSIVPHLKEVLKKPPPAHKEACQKILEASSQELGDSEGDT